jgi:hypothetical protein
MDQNRNSELLGSARRSYLCEFVSLLAPLATVNRASIFLSVVLQTVLGIRSVAALFRL